MPRSKSVGTIEDYQGVIASLPALYTTDAGGLITYFNEAAADFWGRRPAVGVEKWCGSWRLYTSDGVHLPHDECPMAVAIKTCQPVRGAEAIVERPDGSRARFTPFPTPLFDRRGEMTGAVNMLIDISGRKPVQPALRLVASSNAPPPRSARLAPKSGHAATSPPGSLAVAALFDQVARMIHAHDAQVSPLQWAILRYLSRSRRERDRLQIAAYLGVADADLGAHISTLALQGLLGRASRPDGGETFSLTERGRAALQGDPQLRLARAIDRLGETDRSALAKGLETAAEHVREDGEDA